MLCSCKPSGNSHGEELKDRAIAIASFMDKKVSSPIRSPTSVARAAAAAPSVGAPQAIQLCT
eukprot:CAMPEP_0206552566 /NCGR_PEP_ID=MMETSP0325_2-20121206/16158_1 /ASSEMBLY_ACC=CAM_ASM_000347 /TAXON_ID=2866 /ORGANISM="Crypthecodinium cohnii, Strain Seligo" /LENGTH=61 /DNA_ID=CAMNT_0054052467 /DNA_START=1240 /DNA_END=1425 /DNA_ORIENTATION=-